MTNYQGFTNVFKNTKNDAQSNAKTSRLKIVPKDRQTNEESTAVYFLPSNKKKTKIELTKSPTDTSSVLFATTTMLKNNPVNIAKIMTKDGDEISINIINNLIVHNIKTQEIVIDTTKKCLDSNVTLAQIGAYTHSSEYELKAKPSLILNINEKDVYLFEMSEFFTIPYTKKEIKAFIKKKMNMIQNSQKNITKYS